jgi:hypothetical protein
MGIFTERHQYPSSSMAWRKGPDCTAGNEPLHVPVYTELPRHLFPGRRPFFNHSESNRRNLADLLNLKNRPNRPLTAQAGKRQVMAPGGLFRLENSNSVVMSFF